MIEESTRSTRPCGHHKDREDCPALRLLEERVRKLEDQAHAAFFSKLKAPPRKRTVRKPSFMSRPVVKRKARSPVCPNCSKPLNPAELAVMTSAFCRHCDAHFDIA